MSRSSKLPKTGGKAVDSHCQNNGTCPTCQSNRTIAAQKEQGRVVELLREYLRNTPSAELEADWAAIEALDIQGPTLAQVLQLAKTNHRP